MPLNEIRKYFGIDNVAQFRKEWSDLSESDKTDIKSGLTDGTLTY
jgi:hypothetical protein